MEATQGVEYSNIGIEYANIMRYICLFSWLGCSKNTITQLNVYWLEVVTLHNDKQPKLAGVVEVDETAFGVVKKVPVLRTS